MRHDKERDTRYHHHDYQRPRNFNPHENRHKPYYQKFHHQDYHSDKKRSRSLSYRATDSDK